ncbi:hypothetical protein DL98DRAFT_618483 [Cadophora sp. DSE1049]|nr:hypothetical protein DL98DRAFT_618483 [Cadophora sp. DSE1049]
MSYSNYNQSWQNEEQTAVPAVVDSAWSQQYDLPARHASNAQSGMDETPSSLGYSPFGPREGNLQDSLLNQTVQGPPQPKFPQQEEQYQHIQGQFASGLESLITNADSRYHQPSQVQLQQWENEYQQSQSQLPARFEDSMPAPVLTQPLLWQFHLQYWQDECERRLQKWEEEYQQARGQLPEGLEDLINESVPTIQQAPQTEVQQQEGEYQQSQDQFPGRMEDLMTDPVSTFELSQTQIQQWDNEFWQSHGQFPAEEQPLMTDPVSQHLQQPSSQDYQRFAPQQQPQGQFNADGEALTSGYASPYPTMAPPLPPQGFDPQWQPEPLAQQQLLQEKQSEEEQLVPLFSGQMEGDCPIQCPRCILRFVTKRQLRTHESIHDVTKPHVCPFLGCNARYNDRVLLSVHISGHSGQVMCPYCGEFFLSHQALSWHLRTTEHK